MPARNILPPERVNLFLRQPKTSLRRYVLGDNKAARTEDVVAQAFALAFHAPYYDEITDDPTESCRVTWHGRQSRPYTKAPGAQTASPSTAVVHTGQDITIRADGVHVLVEATQATGNKQWSREFAQLLRHRGAYALRESLDEKRVYAILVAPEMADDTWRSLAGVGEPRCTFVEFGILASLADVAAMVLTMRRCDAEELLSELGSVLLDHPDKTKAVEHQRVVFEEWRRRMLDRERSVFVGLEAYLAMLKIGGGHSHFVSAAQILSRLQSDARVLKYFNYLGRPLNVSDVEKGLDWGGFLRQKTRSLYADIEDVLFIPVAKTEFVCRFGRIIEHVRRTS